jgi:hypothetical protein
MRKGEKEMAVVIYTVTVDGDDNITITPDDNSVELRKGDFLKFVQGPGFEKEIRLQMTGVTRLYGAASNAIVFGVPELDGDGNVVIVMEDDGGNPGGGGPYP